MKKYLTFLIVFGFLIATFATFYDRTEETLLSSAETHALGFSGFENINPNMQIYDFKRIYEQVNLKLKHSESEREEYKFKLLNTRFKELIFIINSKKTSFLPENITRYNGYIGALKPEYPVIEPRYKDQVKRNIAILEIFRDRYPANSSHWLSIQQAIDTTRSLE